MPQCGGAVKRRFSATHPSGRCRRGGRPDRSPSAMEWINVARWDRGVRVLLGVVLLGLAFGGVVGGLLGASFRLLGWFPLVTGLVGWCPFYALFGRGSSSPRAR